MFGSLVECGLKHTKKQRWAGESCGCDVQIVLTHSPKQQCTPVRQLKKITRPFWDLFSSWTPKNLKPFRIPLENGCTFPLHPFVLLNKHILLMFFYLWYCVLQESSVELPKGRNTFYCAVHTVMLKDHGRFERVMQISTGTTDSVLRENKVSMKQAYRVPFERNSARAWKTLVCRVR